MKKNIEIISMEKIIEILENKSYDSLEEYYCDNHLDMHYDIHLPDSENFIRFIHFPMTMRGIENRIMVYVIGPDGEVPDFIHHRYTVNSKDKYFFILDYLVEDLKDEIERRKEAEKELERMKDELKENNEEENNNEEK